MKKWLFAFFVIFLITAGFFYWKKPTPQALPPNSVLSANKMPTTIPAAWKQSTVIDVDDVPIRISWAQVLPIEVELYSNLKEQKLSEEIKVNKSCQILVNGGFYSKENTHLGLFVSNFEEISKQIQNPTLNGFLSIDSADKVMISADLSDNNPRIALQTGPLLMLDNKPLTLVINNDEPKRRIVAATTDDNKLIFLAFYRDLAEYEGPMLEKLPEIIDLIKKQTGMDIVDAINLDGGSASVFISNYDRLNEFVHIGSYFCTK
ncbi:MAG: phosphodiester glycosidase family protein [Candidatus Levybacteria bacterium]|nr:phosphodiester glycosidase family protein [Candidatus Levybacteria bacterium]